MARYQVNLQKRLSAAFPSVNYTTGVFANDLLGAQDREGFNPYKGSSEISVRDNSFTASWLPVFDAIEVRSTESNLVYNFEHDPLVDISYQKQIIE